MGVIAVSDLLHAGTATRQFISVILCVPFQEYFVRIGMVSSAKETKFKPAYNPYTEPSMEIFGYHPQLKKLIEVEL